MLLVNFAFVDIWLGNETRIFWGWWTSLEKPENINWQLRLKWEEQIYSWKHIQLPFCSIKIVLAWDNKTLAVSRYFVFFLMLFVVSSKVFCFWSKSRISSHGYMAGAAIWFIISTEEMAYIRKLWSYRKWIFKVFRIWILFERRSAPTY